MAKLWCATSTCRWIPRCEVGSAPRQLLRACGAWCGHALARSRAGRSVAELRLSSERVRDRNVRLADYAVVDAKAIERKVGGSGLPISTSLGVLGLNGLTAYFALLDIGQPKAGETVVVSTAAGAVGSCVGQIAKIKACRTVGIAGGADKARMCREDFRYDAAVDYKADDFESALDGACPEGVDVYFDNTAGSISDSIMRRLNVGARVVICGTASIAASRGSSRHRVRSRGSIAARISASASFGS